MARRSVATIDSPEFINIKPYNPLISECEIKVMYVGENRNRSYIFRPRHLHYCHRLLRHVYDGIARRHG